MENKLNGFSFLDALVEEIDRKDKLHSKKIKGNIAFLKSEFPQQFQELVGLVKAYFDDLNLPPQRVASDYLKMIRDMRTEGLYFYKEGEYRCNSQNHANEYVYSKPEVMTYYMNALLVSQIMWKHHFNAFMYFQGKLRNLFKDQINPTILDVGPGHGFFSFIVKKEFPSYKKIDVVDISDTSLEMTKNILGSDFDKIQYYKKDIFEYDDSTKYDFIVLGEVIEHLDDPKQILLKLAKLLNPNGHLWVTTPTNSPALDHVYLFNTKDEVVSLIEESNLKIVDSFSCFAEDVDEQTALKKKVTNLVGLFCEKSDQMK
jgi:2-polyprenyl-3-methyl-5-hydroxy-6-metoxy-1,4-benzoquinol methylase